MRALLIGLFAWTLAAQTPDPQVVFEVATVRHGPVGDYSVGGTGCPGADPTRCFVENCPLSSLVQMAYGVHSYQISGPAWLDDERFTINAKAPEGTSGKQLSLMLRNLLVERFQMAAHVETRQTTGYDLVVGKGGPKLTASPGPPKQDDDAKAPAGLKLDREGFPELPPGRTFWMALSHGRARWRFVDESMDDFAERIGDAVIQKPTVNATGLKGKYDFGLSYATTSLQVSAPLDAGPTIFDAIQAQLGLKLEVKKVPVETVVIDRIARTPREN